jgi:hypothetical protein
MRWKKLILLVWYSVGRVSKIPLGITKVLQYEPLVCRALVLCFLPCCFILLWCFILYLGALSCLAVLLHLVVSPCALMLCLALLLRITPCPAFSFRNLLLHLALFILNCTLLLPFPPYYSPSPYYFALPCYFTLPYCFTSPCCSP